MSEEYKYSKKSSHHYLKANKSPKSLIDTIDTTKIRPEPRPESLESKAIEEILRDTKRGAARAEIGGAYGWKASPKINSRLLGNTIIQVIQTNKRNIRKSSGSNKKITKNDSSHTKSEQASDYKRPIEEGSNLNLENFGAHKKSRKCPNHSRDLNEPGSSRSLKEKDGK